MRLANVVFYGLLHDANASRGQRGFVPGPHLESILNES
jgi:hypothetical protein